MKRRVFLGAVSVTTLPLLAGCTGDGTENPSTPSSTPTTGIDPESTTAPTTTTQTPQYDTGVLADRTLTNRREYQPELVRGQELVVQVSGIGEGEKLRLLASHGGAFVIREHIYEDGETRFTVDSSGRYNLQVYPGRHAIPRDADVELDIKIKTTEPVSDPPAEDAVDTGVLYDATLRHRHEFPGTLSTDQTIVLDAREIADGEELFFTVSNGVEFVVREHFYEARTAEFPVEEDGWHNLTLSAKRAEPPHDEPVEMKATLKLR